jgi:hypothetical protein
MSHCAPAREDKSQYTCYTIDELKEIAAVINAKHKAAIKIVPQEKLSQEKYKYYLWNSIKNALKECSDEICWSKETRKVDLKKIFRPKGPGKIDAWLSNFDINDVMAQYEAKYPNFTYLGTSPVDWEKINSPLKYISIPDLYKKGKTKFAIVFNLDHHDEPGSHWVACFVDLDKDHSVEYFDSTATKRYEEIPKHIRRFIIESRIISLFYLGINLKIVFNTKKLQYDDNNCGVHCINFIVNRLQGISLEDYINLSNNKDRDMVKNRLYFFRPTETGGKNRKKNPVKKKIQK